MKGKTVAAIVFTSLALGACDYDTDVKVLQTFLGWNQLGSSADQWLEQYSAMGDEWDKIAIVFGLGDDYEGCAIMMKGLMQRFPKARYRCVPAN